MDQALRPEPLGPVGQLVELLAGRAAESGRDDGLDPAAPGQRAVEHAEARGRRPARVDERRRQVDELHPEAQVRLVRAEALDDLVVGEARERDLLDRPVGRRRPRHLDGHRLDEAHHGLLVDEAHLEVELGELRLAVATQVLVAIAARDLEVAVDARDHEQLLELLRALRQGVDAARLEPARDDEVAGALGCRLDERRRLDLDEPVRVMDLADGLDHAAAEQQAVGHRLASDVEVAVLEAQALVDRRIGLVDVERRRLRLGQDLEVGRAQLDLAGRQARVLGPGETAGDLARDGDDELAAHPAGDLVGLRGVGLVDDDLGEAVAVAQVQEDQLAVVAAPVDPAGQPGVRAGIGRPQLAGGVGPIRRGEAGGRGRHGPRMVVRRAGAGRSPGGRSPSR